ncbi:hypothetical protein PARC_p0037 (plasmid) [Pseudoalteromonas arctica A 37-1-2]|uniref:Uncharacterized protein n=1 Tax=Pseudoalteromonas arctica A 37-1-2 TaxID=1117313 RepID=A0A290SEI3_9GAMM|nr:hypothetical protein PARC_p0037 [Pseudoalteromonas arctica A 37-1-2]
MTPFAWSQPDQRWLTFAPKLFRRHSALCCGFKFIITNDRETQS